MRLQVLVLSSYFENKLRTNQVLLNDLEILVVDNRFVVQLFALVDSIVIFVEEFDLHQIMSFFDDYPLLSPTCDSKLLLKWWNLGFWVSHTLLHIGLWNIGQRQSHQEWINNEDISLCSVILEFVFNDLDGNLSWLVEALEYTIFVDVSELWVSLVHLPGVLVRWNWNVLKCDTLIVLILDENELVFKLSGWKDVWYLELGFIVWCLIFFWLSW